MNDYLHRVERCVSDSLQRATVIGLMEDQIIEREHYWERVYIVAWQRHDQCGTHRVHIDSNAKAACFVGHYDMSKVDAIADMLKRAGLEAIR